MKNQKVDTKLGVAILIIIAITVGAFVWKVGKEREVQQSANITLPQKQTQDKGKAMGNSESIDSYENATYGYKIDIPAGFDFKTAGSKEDADSLIKIGLKQDGTELFAVYVETSKFKNIGEWLNDYQKKLTQINSYEGVEINTPIVLSKEKTIVDGEEAMKIVVQNMPYEDYLIVFIKNEFVYKISYNGLFLTDEKSLLEGRSTNEKKLRSEFQLKHRAKLDKIVESFKFVNEIEEVDFCGKVYKAEKIILNDVDVIKRIANISQNKKFRICENIIANTNSTRENLPVKFFKQKSTDADYKDGVYFLNILLQFKIDLNENNIYILGGYDGTPTFIGKLK